MRLPEIVISVMFIFTSVCYGGEMPWSDSSDYTETETDRCKDKINANSRNFVYDRYNGHLSEYEAIKYLNEITYPDCLDLISPSVHKNLLNKPHSTYEDPKFPNKFHLLGVLNDNELDFATSLIKKGADVNHGTRTPFHEATQRGQVQLVKLFLDNRADIHKKCTSECGYTPNGTALHIAAFNRNIVLFKLLLDHGADWKVKTDRNETPLQCVSSEEMKPQFREAVKNHVKTLRERLKDTLMAQNDMNKTVAPEQIDLIAKFLTEEDIHEMFFPTPKKKEEEMEEEMGEEMEKKKKKKKEKKGLLQRAKLLFARLSGDKN